MGVSNLLLNNIRKNKKTNNVFNICELPSTSKVLTPFWGLVFYTPKIIRKTRKQTTYLTSVNCHLYPRCLSPFGCWYFTPEPGIDPPPVVLNSYGFRIKSGMTDTGIFGFLRAFQFFLFTVNSLQCSPEEAKTTLPGSCRDLNLIPLQPYGRTGSWVMYKYKHL